VGATISSWDESKAESGKRKAEKKRADTIEVQTLGKPVVE